MVTDIGKRVAKSYRYTCTIATVAIQIREAIFLFVGGVFLLSAGIYHISVAQITPPESTQPDRSRGAEQSGRDPSIGAQATSPVWLLGAQGTAPDRSRGAQTTSEDLINPENQDSDYDDRLQRNATGNLFRLIEGAFGALIMVVAGLGAIVAAAMGAYKMALTCLVVAVGAFILRALVSLFFGTDYPASDTAGNPIGQIP